MITTRVVPAGDASALTQTLLVEFTEQFCKKYCLNSELQPTAEVEFTASPVTVVDTLAVTTITAKLIATIPARSNCGPAFTKLFVEKFDVAFEATTTNNITMVDGDPVVVPAYRGCCYAKGIKVSVPLTVNISA